jgi:hypothetical protein
LNENSGLTFIDGNLWTFNDGGNAAAIYRINVSTGNIIQTVRITNATNVDWEDITSDANYIYIGDFGNNANGNRQDLKIYKIAKTSLSYDPVQTVTEATAEVINFSYEGQTDFTPRGNNNTEFDCEAFFVKDNQLHLFSKDWVGTERLTKHYTLSTTPGTHQAKYIEQFNVNGLISGADISTTNINEIVLVGYSSNFLEVFMWVLFDYSGNEFFNGNKRKIGLGQSINLSDRTKDRGQIEGITFTTNGNGYISSEKVNRVVFGFTLTVPPRLYSFTTTEWVPLPIELLSFQAVSIEPFITLSWQTASETNNDFFSIERSADAVNFEEIAQKPGAGNSKAVLNYSFTDTNPLDGVNYYRLKQTDLDGTFSYSAIKSALASKNDSYLRISPMPVVRGETLVIEFYDQYSSDSRLILKSTDGKTWLDENISGSPHKQTRLSTCNLTPGMYILQVINQAGIQTAKVVIY